MCKNKPTKKIENAVSGSYAGVYISLNIKTFVLLSLIIFTSSLLSHSVLAKSKNDIMPGDKWKFLKGIKDAPENWQDINFDDSGWFEGSSGIGYGNNPKNGKIIINKDGTFTYIPDKGFTGDDTFVYKVEDDSGAISEAKVTVSVAGVNAFKLNSRQANVESMSFNYKKDNIVYEEGIVNRDVQDQNDKVKLDFGGTDHEFKSDIDDINKHPDINDDFAFVDKDGEVKIDVLKNDDDTDGIINPQTILLGNSEDGELDDMQGNFLGILGRKEFVINDPEELKDLRLGLICDGQAIVFINCIEIFRTEIPVNEKIDISGFGHELFPGRNILAIKCSNDNINSDDFSFIPALEITEGGGK